MDVILLEKIANLGNLGDKVSVKPGYGRNYLIPKGKAAPATAQKLAEFEKRRVELEEAAAETLTAAQARAEAISKLTVIIARKAGDEGKLFGSVGTQDIALAFMEAGAEVKRQEVRLPGGPIRQTGEYEIGIQLHSDLVVTVPIKIVAEA